jgi:hypothetical protein
MIEGIRRRKDGRKEGIEQLNCEATIWKTNGIFHASVRRAIIHTGRSKASLHDQQAPVKVQETNFLLTCVQNITSVPSLTTCINSKGFITWNYRAIFRVVGTGWTTGYDFR